MSWIQTLDGGAFYVLQPDVNLINVDTIATCLSKTCRFKGHCRGFYSVAQHSLLVESLVKTPELKLPALLHDAHEVYSGFGDVASPIKKLPEIREFLDTVENNIDFVIAEYFNFDPQLFIHPEIKAADLLALGIERKNLMSHCDTEWAIPKYEGPITIELDDMFVAKKLFVDRLIELWEI